MSIIAQDSEAPERLPIYTQNYIDNLVHSSTLSEEEKLRIENDVETMTEEEALITIQYLKDNQKETWDEQFKRASK